MHNMKSLILILFWLALYMPAKAQEENVTTRRFLHSVEVIGGPGVSFLRGNSFVEGSYFTSRILKLGFAAGLSLTHNVDKKSYLEANLLYERKGTVVESYTITSLNISKSTTDYTFNYITLPITFNYRIGKSGPSIGAGLFVGWLLNESETEKQYITASIYTRDMSQYYIKWDGGLTLQLRQGFSLLGKRCSIRITNNLGLISTGINMYPGLSMLSNNTMVMFGVGLR